MAKNSIFPLIVLFVVVGVLAAIGFVIYTIVQDITKKTKASMEKRHIQFSKDGMKVSMKEINDEDYKDQTQRCVNFFPFSLSLSLRKFSELINGWVIASWLICGIIRLSLHTRVDYGVMEPRRLKTRVVLRSGMDSYSLDMDNMR